MEEREQSVVSLQAREKELGQEVEERERETSRLGEEAVVGKDKLNVAEASWAGKGWFYILVAGVGNEGKSVKF